MNIYLLPLLAPISLAIAAIVGWRSSAIRPKYAPALAEVATIAAAAVALSSALLLFPRGPRTAELFGFFGLGVSVRLDSVSIIMLLLVSFVGWVVARYSRTYLEGEAGQGRFTAWLCATLGSVFLLIMAGNLLQLYVAWIFTSLALHRLLLFYPERPAAQRAARKKFIVARVGDVALLGALVCLFVRYGTADISAILHAARDDTGGSLVTLAAALLAMAAVLKSAQFPTHGWLVEVMETPTPVSALLHAGVVNAGGFLLIRFADLMILAPGILAILVMLGGFTAIFGALVMLTQSSVKTSLAWSTISQMGFMILECGLGLFALALLHIVAHSVYKAHSFLASGGAVDRVAATRRPGPVAIPGVNAVAQAFGFALAIYVVIAMAFGLFHKSPQSIALGAILVFGVAYLLAQGLADMAPKQLTKRTAVYAIATSASYFSLQAVAQWFTAATLPVVPPPGALEWTLIVLALLSFGLVAFVQSVFPLWAYHPAASGLRVHLSNGLYANAIFDRITDGWLAKQSFKNQ